MIVKEEPLDGRRARRAKNRAAVVDATLDLLESGVISPTAELIAERAGVSVSSVFRYFESIEDLKGETISRYFERFADLFALPEIGIGPLGARIERFVDARLTLYEKVATLARLARARSLEEPQLAESVRWARLVLFKQVSDHFAPELDLRPGIPAGDVADLIDSLTSFESWDIQHTSHKRSQESLRRAWTTGITALLATLTD